MENGLPDEDIMKFGVSIPQIKRVRNIYDLSAWKRAENKE